jgi:hypothetical protein
MVQRGPSAAELGDPVAASRQGLPWVQVWILRWVYKLAHKCPSILWLAWMREETQGMVRRGHILALPRQNLPKSAIAIAIGARDL